MTAKRRRFGTILLVGFGIAAAQSPPPAIPEELKPPSTEAVLLRAAGVGKQIYSCNASPNDPSHFEWVLARPEADLMNQAGEKIGKHFQGPTWEALDGSQVVGQVLQRTNAPHAGSIPWLLLKATATHGSGTFSRVTYIQRVNTKGGVAPAEGCDRSHAGATASVDYQADYYFYGPRL